MHVTTPGSWTMGLTYPGGPQAVNASDANGAGPSTSGSSGAAPLSSTRMEGLQETFQQLTLIFEEEKRSFREREDALRSDIAGLQSEKDAMTKKGIKNSDVIKINVGGAVTSVTRATLCQYPSSLLTYMFSGRWDDQMAHDSDGIPFLDFDPDLFRVILNWLRSQSLGSPAASMMEVPIPAGREEDMLVLVDYLQLQRYMPMWFLETFHPSLHSPNMAVRATTAARDDGNGSNYAVAVSSHTYFDVSVEVALTVNVYDCTEECGQHPMFVGIIAKDTLQGLDLSKRWDITWQKTCYGWWIRPGRTYQVEAGRSRKVAQKELWRSGDSLTLALDCRKDLSEACLKLQLAGTAERSLAINTHELECPEEWLLIVGLTKSGACVTIESARRRGSPAWKYR